MCLSLFPLSLRRGLRQRLTLVDSDANVYRPSVRNASLADLRCISVPDQKDRLCGVEGASTHSSGEPFSRYECHNKTTRILSCSLLQLLQFQLSKLIVKRPPAGRKQHGGALERPGLLEHRLGTFVGNNSSVTCIHQQFLLPAQILEQHLITTSHLRSSLTPPNTDMDPIRFEALNRAALDEFVRQPVQSYMIHHLAKQASLVIRCEEAKQEPFPSRHNFIMN